MPCSNKNHMHTTWARSGSLMIESCEKQCGFCSAKEFRTAANLRKVSGYFSSIDLPPAPIKLWSAVVCIRDLV